ncbi:MAG: RHS repeat-associated core domain-containing protein [Gemmatimonadaceae bacterium]
MPFTQRDPIGLAGGINQYGYAGGDPVNHADPFGLIIDDRDLSQSHRQRIWRLTRKSATFRRWYNLAANSPDTLVIRNTLGEYEEELVAELGGGFYAGNGNGSGTILLNSEGVRRNGEMEWEAVYAHEFSHAVAGMRRGTPANCIGENREACGVDMQNLVHAEIGLRDRTDYDDLGPYTPSTTKPDGTRP